MFLPTRSTEESNEALQNVSDEDKKKLLKDCVTSILVLGQNKSTIKKADLHRHHDRQYYKVNNAILNYASYELFKNCGFRLYEVDKDRLLLVNSSIKFSGYPEYTDETCNELTALLLTIMEIFISSDEKVSNKDLANILTALELNEEIQKSYIDKFVKQLYLIMTKDNTNPEDRYYSWGPRTLAELDPDGFMESFLALAGGVDKEWPEQKSRIDKLRAIPNRHA